MTNKIPNKILEPYLVESFHRVVEGVENVVFERVHSLLALSIHFFAFSLRFFFSNFNFPSNHLFYILSSLMIGFMGTTAFLSMWISNTASTAMMLPIANAVLQQLCDTEANAEEREFNMAAAKNGLDNQAFEMGDAKMSKELQSKENTINLGVWQCPYILLFSVLYYLLTLWLLLFLMFLFLWCFADADKDDSNGIISSMFFTFCLLSNSLA